MIGFGKPITSHSMAWNRPNCGMGGFHEKRQKAKVLPTF